MFPNAWPIRKVSKWILLSSKFKKFTHFTFVKLAKIFNFSPKIFSFWNFSELWALHQHGFARNREFSHKVSENTLEMKLISDDQTRELFPYDFELVLRAEILEKSVQISLIIKNTGYKNMPIAPWLHPYFLIPENQKDRFFLEKNWEKIEDYKKYEWETIYTTNPWIFQAYLWENILELDYGAEFQKLWLRSEPGKDFLCIEPTFWDEWALIDDPCIVHPNQEKIFSMIVKKSQN